LRRAIRYKKLSQPAGLKISIQASHAGGKTVRPNSDLCVYSDHRGNIGIPCFVPRTGSTAPSCTYPSERVTVRHFLRRKRSLPCLDSFAWSRRRQESTRIRKRVPIRQLVSLGVSSISYACRHVSPLLQALKAAVQSERKSKFVPKRWRPTRPICRQNGR
jgi:hypothetical protein